MMTPGTPTLSPRALAALQAGQAIEAIKYIREDHGIGLRESKAVVDSWMARGDWQTPLALATGQPMRATTDEPSAPAADGLSSRVLAALQAGRMVEAIKGIREDHGIGLKDAKTVAEHWAAGRDWQASLTQAIGRQRSGVRPVADPDRHAWVWALPLLLLGALGVWYLWT